MMIMVWEKVLCLAAGITLYAIVNLCDYYNAKDQAKAR